MSNKLYKKTDLKRTVNVKSIITILSYELAPNFHTDEEMHDFWEIVYVERGKISCYFDGIKREIKEGELVFHSPNQKHRLVSASERNASIFVIGFDSHSPAVNFFSNGHFKINSELRQLIARLIEECSNTFSVSRFSLTTLDNAPYASLQLVRNYIEELLIRLIRNEKFTTDIQEEISSKDRTNYALTQQICDYLKERVAERVTLDDISSHFHFGKSRLCDVFKKSQGDTIFGYFNKLKIEEAKRILLEKKITITELSELLGFESPEYFSRTFRKHTQLSPRAYRLKKHNKKA